MRCVECGQPAAERHAEALESEVERVSTERDDYRATALRLSQLLFLAEERAEGAEAEVERLRSAASGACPRRQCRGRISHSLIIHWFGWAFR